MTIYKVELAGDFVDRVAELETTNYPSKTAAELAIWGLHNSIIDETKVVPVRDDDEGERNGGS